VRSAVGSLITAQYQIAAWLTEVKQNSGGLQTKRK